MFQVRVGAALPDGPHLGAGAGRAGAAGHHARHAGAGGRRHPEPALDTRVGGRAAGGTQTADRENILTLALPGVERRHVAQERRELDRGEDGVRDVDLSVQPPVLQGRCPQYHDTMTP